MSGPNSTSVFQFNAAGCALRRRPHGCAVEELENLEHAPKPSAGVPLLEIPIEMSICALEGLTRGEENSTVRRH